MQFGDWSSDVCSSDLKAFGFEESRRRDFPENKFTLVYLTLPGDDYELELTYNYDHG